VQKLTPPDIMLVSSIGLLLFGLWYLYPPLTFIVAGLAGIGVALLLGGARHDR